MSNRLQHDAAFLLTRQVMGLIGHLLREEEHKDAFGEIYQLARTAIGDYAQAEERRRKRMRPEGGKT
jgi:hypothetical protein